MKAHQRFGMLLLVTVLCLTAAAEASVPGTAAGLSVGLYQNDALYTQTTTDDGGFFLLENVVPATYWLKVENPPEGTMSLQFQVTVEDDPATPEQDLSAVIGQVSAYADSDIGVKVTARIVSQEAGGDIVVDGAVVKPKRWNVNFAHSMGQIKAKLWGSGLSGVAAVTLKSDDSHAITSTIIRVDEEENVAMAVFSKSEVYSAVVPEGTHPGTVLPVSIVVVGPDFTQTFEREVLILGKR